MGFFINIFGDIEFYENIFQEGKAKYNSAKYAEAAANFKIAEFGLREHKILLNDLYQYFSIALFKAGKIKEARETLKKYQAELDIKSFDSINLPPEIKDDFTIMCLILKRTRATALTPKLSQEIRYETIFQKVIESLDKTSLDQLKEAFQKLKKIDKDEVRNKLVFAIFKFYSPKKYRQFIKKTKNILDTLSDHTIRDRAYYFLALSHYHLKNYKKVLALMQNIKQPEVRNRLQQIIQKSESSLKKLKEKEK